MVRWIKWHCPADTWFEISAIAVWGCSFKRGGQSGVRTRVLRLFKHFLPEALFYWSWVKYCCLARIWLTWAGSLLKLISHRACDRFATETNCNSSNSALRFFYWSWVKYCCFARIWLTWAGSLLKLLSHRACDRFATETNCYSSNSALRLNKSESVSNSPLFFVLKILRGLNDELFLSTYLKLLCN